MSLTEQKLNALGAFKDWSNYLLVTTVVALGWVAGADTDKPLTLATKFEVGFLAASVIFGIFTLAVIPIIAERIMDGTESIYGVEAPFNLFWMWGPEKRIRLKAVCWPQHVCFIIAIAFHAAIALATTTSTKGLEKENVELRLKVQTLGEENQACIADLGNKDTNKKAFEPAINNILESLRSANKYVGQAAQLAFGATTNRDVRGCVAVAALARQSAEAAINQLNATAAAIEALPK